MPDLTIEIMQQCKAGLDGKHFQINGYDQFIARNEHTTASCTCKAFQFSTSFPKWCKHLEEAANSLCDYHQQIDGPPETDRVCPKCGGPTEYVKVAV